MTEVAEQITEQPTKHAPRKRKSPARRKTAAGPKAEFAGMTTTECCDGCFANKAAAEAAQKRLNELEMMYPRRPAPPVVNALGWRLPAETVMETDEQFLARNPQIADEWRKLSGKVMGECTISGHPGCAHPFKGGLRSDLRRDPKAVGRYQRAVKALKHQNIDLRD